MKCKPEEVPTIIRKCRRRHFKSKALNVGRVQATILTKIVEYYARNIPECIKNSGGHFEQYI